MLRSDEFIRTTHVGSLPRTPGLMAANSSLADHPEEAGSFLDLLRSSVIDVVEHQKSLGISTPSDGEYGHIMSSAVDYGAWWNYSFSRMSGLTPGGLDRWQQTGTRRSTPGHIVLTTFQDRRDRQLFTEAYNDPTSGILTGEHARVGDGQTCHWKRGPPG